MATKGETATTEVKREVKVVKKQVKKEKKIENGEQNGDENVEADLTVKLPTKKSAAKTETKVEVNKRVLPDGSIEEVKTTTTKTTIDGKTQIKTKTETTIIPKEEEEEVEEEEEQEEESEVVEQEAEEETEMVEEPTLTIKKNVVKKEPVEEKSKKETIVKKEEKSESLTTKKVVVLQKEESKEDEVEEEVEEPEPVTIKKVVERPPTPKPEEEEEDEVEEEVVEETKDEVKRESVKESQTVKEEKEIDEGEEEEEEEEEEVKVIQKPVASKQEVEVNDEEEEKQVETVKEKEIEQVEEKKQIDKESNKQEDEESEYTEEEYESEKEDVSKQTPKESEISKENEEQDKPEDKKPEPEIEKPEVKPDIKPEPTEVKEEKRATPPRQEYKIPLREPSIPLDKVEDVEIKPIGPTSEVISKTHTEIITSTKQLPSGPISTQTEYNKVENFTTVNRTTKTFDQSYEQVTQSGIPTVRTYFAPTRERIGTSPQPSRPYQPAYTPEPTTERRHSLLLDRLSTERQIPSSDIYQNSYQYNNQSYEQQKQWSQEPQSEVLNVSNVKPSKITNQQWYQPNNRDNVIYNNVTPASAPPNVASQPVWGQPPSQPQYQPSYTENTTQERSSSTTYQSNNYPTYVPKPTNWVGNNTDNLPSINTNQYSFLSKDSSENYQKSAQQYSTTYVPPPWEQDSSYVLQTPSQNYYQSAPPTSTFTPSQSQGWQPAPPPNKFTKPPPKAYIPPAPNQSFVKPATVEPPKLPGRKTYYSEYERRYITVPESTYIPGETKFQAQPDPSPQYYYDNNEPTEKVEHEWRKELREFTEKSTTQQTTETSVKPPWEEDSKYGKAPSSYTPTPTWSQTLRPRSWRERSFESEYVGSQEFSKTNTLGRSRPLSTYGKSDAPIPERSRGVSVDRYNPNSYQSPLPSEYPPVQAHTLTATPPVKNYHNPNVPAYHAHPRASAETSEQPATFSQPRLWGCDTRGTPIQSRSFKYLQWITGTED